MHLGRAVFDMRKLPHSASVVEVVLWVHALSTHGVVAFAMSVFQHYVVLLFPMKLEHID